MNFINHSQPSIDPLQDTPTSQPPENHSVWSDLRALQSLTRAQQDIQTLKTSVKRLRFALILSFILLGSSTLILGSVGLATYWQLQSVISNPTSKP